MIWRRFSLSIPVPGIKRDFRIRVSEGGVVAGGTVAVAGVLALLADLGGKADLSFYGTIAQVIPVFLLALVIEVRARLDRAFDVAVAEIEASTLMYEQAREAERYAVARGTDHPGIRSAQKELSRLGDELRALQEELVDHVPVVQLVVRGYVLAAIPGEAGCLAALGAGQGSTFYFCLSILSLIAMTALYMRKVSGRYAVPHRLAPAIDPRAPK